MKLSAAVMAVACFQGISAAPAGKICEERGWNCFGGRLGKMRNIAWNEEAPSHTVKRNEPQPAAPWNDVWQYWGKKRNEPQPAAPWHDIWQYYEKKVSGETKADSTEHK
ncbi:hypothetical protein G6O67_007849 [Ophiocordyceps sinensis]|uniref:Uncharacterized protein n=1 Tax=Ophiocordyceps sinensis TaxID=72228 RepID=A0A8H4LUP6_9HYPO|nr:hypothetical protein G6O67_007849 [Ophiocordyceps sinensis]